MTNTIPKTKREAFAQLDKMLSKQERNDFATSKEVFEYHFSLGLWIRNNWIHGQCEEDVNLLSKLFHKDNLFFDPDLLSYVILTEYRRHVKNQVRRR